MDYQISVEEYKKETQAYRRNKEKLYGYLKENCTAMMLTKLESECQKTPPRHQARNDAFNSF